MTLPGRGSRTPSFWSAGDLIEDLEYVGRSEEDLECRCQTIPTPTVAWAREAWTA
jgi:hypothetical protein